MRVKCSKLAKWIDTLKAGKFACTLRQISLPAFVFELACSGKFLDACATH